MDTLERLDADMAELTKTYKHDKKLIMREIMSVKAIRRLPDEFLLAKRALQVALDIGTAAGTWADLARRFNMSVPNVKKTMDLAPKYQDELVRRGLLELHTFSRRFS